MSDELVRCRQVLQQGIDTGWHGGAQVSVWTGDRQIDLTIGNRRAGLVMQPDSINLWMSAIKPAVAIAVAMLWERGQLELDDPVARHLPGFETGGKADITLRHLLTHTAGFRGPVIPWNEPWDRAIQRVIAARLEPNWVVGQTAGYHVHTAWYALAAVVERVSGHTCETMVRQEIFLPLQMSDCWMSLPSDAYHAYGDRLATVYDTAGGFDSATAPPTEQSCAARRPSGNGRGPARQFVRLYRMLLGGGELDGTRILRRQTVEALTSAHRVGLHDRTFNATIDWGLGFILDSKHYLQTTLPYGYGPHASRRTYGHSGNQCSCAFADPVHHLAVAWVCNGTPGESAHQQRQTAINQAIYEDLKV